jgi:hypothetical protein
LLSTALTVDCCIGLDKQMHLKHDAASTVLCCAAACCVQPWQPQRISSMSRVPSRYVSRMLTSVRCFRGWWLLLVNTFSTGLCSPHWLNWECLSVDRMLCTTGVRQPLPSCFVYWVHVCYHVTSALQVGKREAQMLLSFSLHVVQKRCSSALAIW